MEMNATGPKDQKLGMGAGCHPALQGATQNLARHVSFDFSLSSEDVPLDLDHPQVRAEFWEFVEKYSGTIKEDDIDGAKAITQDQCALPPDDDVGICTVEAQMAQNTLNELHEKNSEALKKVIHTGQRAMDRRVQETELEKVDHQLLQHYKNIARQRAEAKAIPEEEMDAVKKYLEARQTLLKRLEDMNV